MKRVKIELCVFIYSLLDLYFYTISTLQAFSTFILIFQQWNAVSVIHWLQVIEQKRKLQHWNVQDLVSRNVGSPLVSNKRA